MAKQLVRLWERPSYDGRRFRYYLLYTDEQGKRRQKSLGHADRRKAERQRAQFERRLLMGAVGPGSMKLSDFVEDSLKRTGDQIRDWLFVNGAIRTAAGVDTRPLSTHNLIIKTDGTFQEQNVKSGKLVGITHYGMDLAVGGVGEGVRREKAPRLRNKKIPGSMTRGFSFRPVGTPEITFLR